MKLAATARADGRRPVISRRCRPTRTGRAPPPCLPWSRSCSCTASVAASVSSLPLLIGDGYTSGYVGGIDEVAVYDRALSPGEVGEHFAEIVAGDHGRTAGIPSFCGTDKACFKKNSRCFFIQAFYPP